MSDFDDAEPAIHEACRQGNVGLIRQLLNGDPSLVHARGRSNWTPLFIACDNTWRGSFEMVSILLNFSADVNARDDKLNTPLHILMEEFYHWDHPGQGRHAKEMGRRFLYLLLDRGANPNAVNSHGYTPCGVYLVGRSSATETLEMLLEYGMDVNKQVRLYSGLMGSEAWVLDPPRGG